VNTSKIKACFFDIGNVLIFIDTDKLINDLAKLFSTSKNDLVQFIEKEKIIQAFECGLKENEEILSHFNAQFNTNQSLAEFKKTLCQCFEENEQIRPLIQKLHQKIPLFLLSNTSSIHFEYLWQNYPLLHKFQDSILSYKINAMKPDQKIYKRAIELANCAPNSIFYTDDIDEFCRAAQNEKIESHHFKNNQNLQKALTSLYLLPM